MCTNVQRSCKNIPLPQCHLNILKKDSSLPNNHESFFVDRIHDYVKKKTWDKVSAKMLVWLKSVLFLEGILCFIIEPLVSIHPKLSLNSFSVSLVIFLKGDEDAPLPFKKHPLPCNIFGDNLQIFNLKMKRLRMKL